MRYILKAVPYFTHFPIRKNESEAHTSQENSSCSGRERREYSGPVSQPRYVGTLTTYGTKRRAEAGHNASHIRARKSGTVKVIAAGEEGQEQARTMLPTRRTL